MRFQGETFREALRFSHEAMATVFEIFIIHDEQDYAEQAAAAAFGVLDRLELELSRFIDNSDISRINRLKRDQSAVIGLDAFACLQKALDLFEMTGGVFDINFRATQNQNVPGASKRRESRKERMPPAFILDENRHTVLSTMDNIAIDLGGIGKGYGIDRMADLLREWDLHFVLIHGGMSSVLALDVPEDEQGWPLTVSHPQRGDECLSKIFLKNRSVSGSGVRKGQHIIDPRNGVPQENRLAAWALAPDGVKSDAFSTAFMVMTREEIQAFCGMHEDIQGLIVAGGDGEDCTVKFGRWR